MFTLTNMAATEGVPLLMRLVSSAVAVSHRAARIARDVLIKGGDLGVVEKVFSPLLFIEMWQFIMSVSISISP